MKCDRDERGQDPELGRGPRHELAELARQLPERIVDAVAELLGQDDVLEPLPGLWRAVDERGAERTRTQRELEVDEDDGQDQHPGTPGDEPGAPPDPGIDGEHVEPDRDDQQQRQ